LVSFFFITWLSAGGCPPALDTTIPLAAPGKSASVVSDGT